MNYDCIAQICVCLQGTNAKDTAPERGWSEHLEFKAPKFDGLSDCHPFSQVEQPF